MSRRKKKNFKFELLNEIRNQPKGWGELVLRFSNSTLSHYLNLLQNENLVIKMKNVKKYQLTELGERTLQNMTNNLDKKIALPPKAILNQYKIKKDPTDLILWVIYNNDNIAWADFISPPLGLSPSTLSKKLNLLKENKILKKDKNKQYKLALDGVSEYFKMLKKYKLDQQWQLNQKRKKILEINEEFENNFKDDEYLDNLSSDDYEQIKFRIINLRLQVDLDGIPSTEELYLLFLYLSLNHPDRYPEYLTIEDFSNTYNIDVINLKYYLKTLVDDEKYPFKIFRLYNLNKIYYFTQGERIDRILTCILEETINKYFYINLQASNKNLELSKYYLNIFTEVVSFLCLENNIFNKGLKSSIFEFLKEYLKYRKFKEDVPYFQVIDTIELESVNVYLDELQTDKNKNYLKKFFEAELPSLLEIPEYLKQFDEFNISRYLKISQDLSFDVSNQIIEDVWYPIIKSNKIFILAGQQQSNNRILIGYWDYLGISKINSYFLKRSKKLEINFQKAFPINPKLSINEKSEIWGNKNLVLLGTPDTNSGSGIFLSEIFFRRNNAKRKILKEPWFIKIENKKIVSDQPQKTRPAVVNESFEVSGKIFNLLCKNCKSFNDCLLSNRIETLKSQAKISKEDFEELEILRLNRRKTAISFTGGDKNFIGLCAKYEDGKYLGLGHIVLADNPFSLDKNGVYKVVVIEGLKGPVTYELVELLFSDSEEDNQIFKDFKTKFSQALSTKGGFREFIFLTKIYKSNKVEEYSDGRENRGIFPLFFEIKDEKIVFNNNTPQPSMVIEGDGWNIKN